eukprot:UN00592
MATYSASQMVVVKILILAIVLIFKMPLVIKVFRWGIFNTTEVFKRKVSILPTQL